MYLIKFIVFKMKYARLCHNENGYRFIRFNEMFFS